MIEPRILKGFRDSLPQQELRRKDLITCLESVFSSFGLVPIDTPVLEYTEVLLGKGGGETDKQVYTFTDHGGREVAMRFDLTVPFARYMASHAHELPLPFKRYHVDKVWRGENTQKGRYREFYQCDFDIVGIDHVSADFEILLIINESLKRLGIPAFSVHLSHRGIFNSFLADLGIADRAPDILRCVDKMQKIGLSEVEAQLQEIITIQQTRDVLAFISASGTPLEVLSALGDLCGKAQEHIHRLSILTDFAMDAGCADTLVINPSITRGLDYYTGVVYETYLDELEAIGSICSGGRYNDLASLYTKQKLPGVGASIGLDRLLAALDELSDTPSRSSTADVLVICMDESRMGDYQRIACRLREAGLHAEVSLTKRRLPQQFSYAERVGIPLALILGEEELESGTYTLRDLQSRMQERLQSIEKLVNRCRLLTGKGAHTL